VGGDLSLLDDLSGAELRARLAQAGCPNPDALVDRRDNDPEARRSIARILGWK
jgi:hypothetical protein